jgi:hypothetical protein
MADAFATKLREFERLVAEVSETRERLQFLEWQRDQLRKELKSLAGGVAVDSDGAVVPRAPHQRRRSDSVTPAVLEMVRALRALDGSGGLSDIASKAALDKKVAAMRLQRAVQLGLIERHGHGLYKLPDDELKVIVENGAASPVEQESGHVESSETGT